jgi:peptide/nickel transport system permease protein
VLRLIVGRVAQAALVAGLVATLTFFLVHAAPGDPFSGLAESQTIAAADVARLRAEFGLDRPLHEQYLRYVGRVAHGDLGMSITQSRPVAGLIAAALPRTLVLMATALVASFALGMLLGVLQAARRGSTFDRASRGATLLAYSLPDFWLAAMLLTLVAVRWGLLSAGGVTWQLEAQGPFELLVARMRGLVLPVLTLTVLYTALVARHQRAALLETLPEDYVRTARAKGLSEGSVLRHAWRNALLPIVTLGGLTLPALFGGAVVVERVFNQAGVGSLIVGAIGERDYFLLVGCVLVGGALVALGSLLADLAALVLDPRQRAA